MVLEGVQLLEISPTAVESVTFRDPSESQAEGRTLRSVPSYHILNCGIAVASNSQPSRHKPPRLSVCWGRPCYTNGTGLVMAHDKSDSGKWISSLHSGTRVVCGLFVGNIGVLTCSQFFASYSSNRQDIKKIPNNNADGDEKLMYSCFKHQNANTITIL